VQEFSSLLKSITLQLKHIVIPLSSSQVATRVARFIFSKKAKPSVKKGQTFSKKRPKMANKIAEKSQTLN